MSELCFYKLLIYYQYFDYLAQEITSFRIFLINTSMTLDKKSQVFAYFLSIFRRPCTRNHKFSYISYQYFDNLAQEITSFRIFPVNTSTTLHKKSQAFVYFLSILRWPWTRNHKFSYIFHSVHCKQLRNLKHSAKNAQNIVP